MYGMYYRAALTTPTNAVHAHFAFGRDVKRTLIFGSLAEKHPRSPDEGIAMMKASALTASSFFLLTMFSGAVVAAEQQFSCKGQMIEPSGEPKAPANLKLTLGDHGKATIEMGGNEKLNARVISDNKIQTKYQTKEFVGEFFHYTGDLFLIYKSGKLARLSCSHG